MLDCGRVCCSYNLYNSTQNLHSVHIGVSLIPPLLFLRLTRVNRKGEGVGGVRDAFANVYLRATQIQPSVLLFYSPCLTLLEHVLRWHL